MASLVTCRSAISSGEMEREDHELTALCRYPYSGTSQRKVRNSVLHGPLEKTRTRHRSGRGAPTIKPFDVIPLYLLPPRSLSGVGFPRGDAVAAGGGAVPGGAPSEKNSYTDTPRRRRYQRMSAAEKAEVLVTVASSPTPKRKVLRELGVARSTYYRWLRRREQRGLENDAGGGRPPWNRMTSLEVDHVLSVAREMPDLSNPLQPRGIQRWRDHRCLGIFRGPAQQPVQ